MTIEMIVVLIGASVVAYAIANRFRLIAPVLLLSLIHISEPTRP